MSLPKVTIKLGSGGLGQTAATSDGVAGLVLTGKAEGKLELNQPYQFSSTRDLKTLEITTEQNPLLTKEVKAFYAEAGDGAELHLLVVSESSLLTTMCDPSDESPLLMLINASGGRIRLVGVNKLAPTEYVADLSQGIDHDAIMAAEKAHQTAENCASQHRPFRLFVPAPQWNGETANLYKPAESSYNRVAFILASDSKIGEEYSASIGQVLGRAAKMEPQQSIGRVKSGAIASDGFFTSGDNFLTKAGLAESLDDAGYIFYRNYPAKNGCYLNGGPMATTPTDDYSQLHLGRIIDKASVIAYTTYITEILENIVVDENGALSPGVCKSFSGMIENAIASNMGSQISNFSAYIDPRQNILSNGRMEIDCKLVPLGVLQEIVVNLSFENPTVH